MTFELKPFQKKAVRIIDHYKGNVLIADEMGLGKTIEVLQWLKEHPEIRPVIIIVPAHLKWNWQNEAADKFGLKSTVLNSRTPSKLNLEVCNIFIISYDILSPVEVKTKNKQNKTMTKKYDGWLQTLVDIKAACLIADEIHFCKGRNTKRTKAIKKLSQKIPHKLPLSGTPLLNRPAELFPTLNMLWPKDFSSFFSFAQRYCKPVRMPWGWVYKGATHIDELHQRLLTLGMIRRKKSEVLKYLPPKQRSVIPINIPMKEYDQAKNNFINWLQAQSPERARKAKLAQAITQLGYLKRLASKEKLPFVIDWIKSYLNESADKLVVFGIHKEIVRGLHEQFPNISVCLDGGTPIKTRKTIEKQFQTNKKIRLFFGNIQAAGTGMNLWASPSLAFAELDWVPGNHTQAEDRIHRIGQTQHTDIYYLVAKNTIEEQLCKVIQEKQQIVNQVLDGVNIEQDKLDIYDILSKELLKGIKIENKQEDYLRMIGAF